MRLSIRQKIILPFAVLLVFVGVVGTGVATTQLTNSAVASFDANLLHSSLVANQLLAQLDLARTADLRLATDTQGVPEAVLSTDVPTLTRLLAPIAANITATSTVVCVVDSRGNLLLTIENSADGPGAVAIGDVASFAQQSDVVSVLSAATDTGERRAFLWNNGTTPFIYWVGPIRISSGRIVGASLIGESLAEVAHSIQESALYDLAGTRLASSLASPADLPSAIRRQITADNAQQIDDRQGAHVYRALFSTWMMRGRQVGFLAVEANADPLFSLVDQVRLILTLIFTAAAVLTLFVGSATASLLMRPVELLVKSMRIVSAGDFHHRATVVSRDEIGYLARTFNEVTASLEEKTVALEQTTFAAIEALARAIDARDASTFGHSARVAAISLEIADAVQLPEKEREALRRAALLHDIGKIGVEDRVLRKPGPLNQLEADDMREHPRIGYDMLKGLPFLQASLPGVLYHHERWDGAGYPAGLTGTAVPLPVRILAVADVFDALTSDRPYREGLSFTAAAAAIRNEAGLQFDPDVVTVFLSRRDAIEATLQKMGKPGSVQAEPEAA
jgi:putative nucleotidyltransferase with HDIG domain